MGQAAQAGQEMLCAAALEEGHMAVLGWLRQHGTSGIEGSHAVSAAGGNVL